MVMERERTLSQEQREPRRDPSYFEGLLRVVVIGTEMLGLECSIVNSR